MSSFECLVVRILVFQPLSGLSPLCLTLCVPPWLPIVSPVLSLWLDYGRCFVFNQFPFGTDCLCHCSPSLIGCHLSHPRLCLCLGFFSIKCLLGGRRLYCWHLCVAIGSYPAQFLTAFRATDCWIYFSPFLCISLSSFHCKIFMPLKVWPIVHAIGDGNSTFFFVDFKDLLLITMANMALVKKCFYYISEIGLYLFVYLYSVFWFCFATFWRFSCILSCLSIVWMFTCVLSPNTLRVRVSRFGYHLEIMYKWV